MVPSYQSNVKVSITHKFKTEIKEFPRNQEFTATEIINKVIKNGWFYEKNSKKDNERMVRGAIQEGILTGRIKKIDRGKYVFLPQSIKS